jgi:nitrate/TMAO reductase-like tetraheme cytochrome c subunit
VGAWVGKFTPTDNKCVTCHRSDLARATNPNHIAVGWVESCNRCHVPTTWKQAETN